MIHKLGMPYQGSKRKLAKPIVDKILADNPGTKYVFDLFGGGGAMSFELLQRPGIKLVVYNELNTGVVELLKDIQSTGVTSKYYQWIDRETFNANKNKNDWLGGFCKVLWSFGNAQTCYLFGKPIEYNKRLAHLMIVNKDKDALLELANILEIDIPKNILDIESINNRRLKFSSIARENRKRFDLEQLQNLQNLQQLQQLQRLERLEQLQQLQQLERLEQLQHNIKKQPSLLDEQHLYLDDLDIQNKSFENVIIDTPVAETIIYLDPPYKGTREYEKKLNHDLLVDYINNSRYKIYMSSYNSRLRCIAEYSHRCTLSATANNKVTEKLFVRNIGERVANIFNI